MTTIKLENGALLDQLLCLTSIDDAVIVEDEEVQDDELSNVDDNKLLQLQQQDSDSGQ